MADEGQTNFLRSILLLIEGGSYISRAIINRESTKTGRDINSLLGDFKTKLEHEFHGKQYQKLFPDTGEKTDINRWDLQLLIGVICIVFRKSISRSEKKDLLVIKQLRNDVFMHGAYASLDEEEYEEVIEQLEDSLNGLASTFEESVQEVCFTFIKNFKSGPLDALRPSIAALNGLSQTTQRKFTVGVSTELAVDGPSKYWTELCEDILETILNAAISRNESDGLENIRTKVTKMLEYLLANVDIVFQGCMRACIILKFECNSYEDMLYLLNKLDSWEHRYHLNKISNALTKEHKLNGLLNITSRVTTECLQSILIQRIKMLHEEEMGDDCLEVTSHTNYENKDEDKETYPKQDSDGIVSLTEDVRKPLKLGLECKSKEGLMHMLNLFKGNELQVHLKDVADALSEHVRKKVTLKTSLNIEDFMSAFEEAVIAERYEDRQLMTFVSRPDDISEDTQQQSESPIMEETFVPTKQEKLEVCESPERKSYDEVEVNDPGKHFVNMAHLVKKYDNNEEIIDALVQEVLPRLHQIVGNAAKDDDDIEESLEEVYELERPENSNAKENIYTDSKEVDIITDSGESENNEYGEKGNDNDMNDREDLVEQRSSDENDEDYTGLLFSEMNSGSKPGDIQRYTVRVTDRYSRHDFLTFCRISPEEIVMAERVNRKVKKLDNSYKVIESLGLYDWPFDICSIGNHECVVALPGRKLQFVNAKEKIELSKTVTINHDCTGLTFYEGDCTGLTFYEGKLYIADTKSVYLYSRDGEMLGHLYTNFSENSLFRQIAVSLDGNKIYVTNFKSGLITIDLTRPDASPVSFVLHNAEGLSVDDEGNVLMCGCRSNTVLKVSPEGKKELDVISVSNDIDVDNTALYYDRQNKCLLSSGSKGDITVLKVFEPTK